MVHCSQQDYLLTASTQPFLTDGLHRKLLHEMLHTMKDHGLTPQELKLCSTSEIASPASRATDVHLTTPLVDDRMYVRTYV